MSQREPFPAPRPSNEPLDGMTEATGSLTPDDGDEAFVPAERRELTDAGAARDVTAAAYGRGAARRASLPDEPGSLIPGGENMPPNDRDGGYGSEHGLAGDDAAYQVEARLPETRRTQPHGETRLGSDTESSPREDRF